MAKHKWLVKESFTSKFFQQKIYQYSSRLFIVSRPATVEQITDVANVLTNDSISFEEEREEVLEKYYEYGKKKFNLDDSSAKKLIQDALIYLELKNSKDVDPLQEGEKFGVGFS